MLWCGNLFYATFVAIKMFEKHLLCLAQRLLKSRSDWCRKNSEVCLNYKSLLLWVHCLSDVLGIDWYLTLFRISLDNLKFSACTWGFVVNVLAIFEDRFRTKRQNLADCLQWLCSWRILWTYGWWEACVVPHILTDLNYSKSWNEQPFSPIGERFSEF